MNWKAYQLNPNASDTPSLKIDMYAQKFGRTRDQVMQMAASMDQKFKAVGLPHNFSEKSLVSNTMDGHRVIAWTGADGPGPQDRAMERLFKGYFAEEKAPNDVGVLVEAAVAAGKTEADARAFVADKSAMRQEVQKELAEARAIPGLSGVPHFIIRKPNQRPVSVSGAQPPEAFARILQG